jgi:anti-sigma factor RsiW
MVTLPQLRYLTVFVAPSEGERFDGARRTSWNGYNVLQWISGDLTCRVVSDLNDQELQEFAALMQQSTGK